MNAQPPSQELAPIPDADALSIFSATNGLEPWLQHVRREIDTFVADATTAKGRKEIASIAYKVAQSKAYLENVGKAVAAEAKEIPKKIDAERKRMRDTLDQWRDEVRQPLTEWETADATRVKAHADKINALLAIPSLASETSVAALTAEMDAANAVQIGPQCEEFETAYARAKDAAITFLKGAIARRTTYENEQYELARFRAEAEVRAAKERDERIAREAAEKAKADAEAKARAEQDRVERERIAAIAKAEAAANAEREAAARRELELKLQAEAAERRAAETEARIKREADAAAAREKAETAKREADRAHKGKINRAAVAAFVSGGLPEDMAKTAVSLIAQKAVPAISISY